ncbi:primary-amine oxidase [Capronia coronata CBS 617.96]|uniref:Amine oxidase n=1 Tax=Capronia coronata CBS 617.96 TaxID=1182541 RepID=W9Y0A4_9EURO|nr:primary-amine oxidase [Capronia coronata CBS 617.96]EXJ83065.1 primary-amine oxidase [Capronia coronata CBS 617.96]
MATAPIPALSPLTSAEISTCSSIIEAAFPPGTKFHFKFIMLQEPPKETVVAFINANKEGKPRPSIERLAFVAYYIKDTPLFHEAIVSLSQRKILKNVRLPDDVHGCLDGPEQEEIERICLSHPDVQAALAELQLPPGAFVVGEAWMYGSDGINDTTRQYQMYLYMRDPDNSTEPDSNHYAFPLPVSPVFDATTKKLIRIDTLPTGTEFEATGVKPWKPKPANEYLPECQESLRTDIKPLRVIQPEGASFKISKVGERGTTVEWQKWSFQTGFNQREGLILYNVHYDGRSLFYRMSLSEMSVPYGDPRMPYHRKAAFDLGDAGAGATANNLQLGCDCLGLIQYLDGVVCDADGKPEARNNCVCIHEQDSGIGWKHTNFRTNRAVVTRGRELVLQTILTLANYEYILAFVFNQAGEIHYEVRATGILNTQPIDDDLFESAFGTVVHPGVLAAVHQHLFSLRVDPAIEGHANRLVYDEACTLPRDPATNPHGMGYMVKETVVDKSGGYDLDLANSRTYKIQNAAVKNPINKKSVAYKIQVPPVQLLIADPESYHHKRAEFADHHIYVTKYQDDELYAGGKYTNQSRGGTGVRSWAARKDNIVDEDLVVFVQFGLNHIPRIEDFPVMPVEIIRVAFKPANFFTKNPAIDVPPSTQNFNQSRLAQSLEGDCCAPRL